MSEPTMITLDDFQELMRRVEAVRRKRHEELGGIRERKRVLKETYGVDTLAEARELRDRRHRKLMKTAQACQDAKKEFEAALAKRPQKPEE